MYLQNFHQQIHYVTSYSTQSSSAQSPIPSSSAQSPIPSSSDQSPSTKLPKMPTITPTMVAKIVGSPRRQSFDFLNRLEEKAKQSLRLLFGSPISTPGSQIHYKLID